MVQIIADEVKKANVDLDIRIYPAKSLYKPKEQWKPMTTGQLDIYPLILFLLIFIWTPPHFWPLAIDRMEEYKKEGVPMMPIAKGVSRTKKEMVIYAVLLLGASLSPFFYGLTGYFYLVSTTALNLYFIYLCISYLNDDNNQLSMKIFNFSVRYMLLFFLATYIDFLIMLYV